jgi:hypothetical protein
LADFDPPALKATEMKRFRNVSAIAAISAVLMTQYALGAAVDAPDSDMVGAIRGFAPSTPGVEHQLDVEMTVRNWVLCASQPFAERLVRARVESREAAQEAFADLATARSCGQLAEMQVILQAPLYDAFLGSGGHAGVYSALINISGAWASGFVVYGGLPED